MAINGTNPYPVGSTPYNAWAANNAKVNGLPAPKPVPLPSNTGYPNTPYTTPTPQYKLAPFPTQQEAVGPAPSNPVLSQPPLIQGQAVGKSPFQTGFGLTSGGPQQGNTLSSLFTSKLPAKPPAVPPGNNPFSSLPNLQSYIDPNLDFIINKGNQAIQSSAAARGSLMSSGTINDVGDWTATAASKAWQDAFNNYNVDRNFGAGRSDQAWLQYAQERGLDSSDYQYENNYRTNNFNTMATAYTKLMSNRQANIQALAEGGPKMMALAADLATALGESQANIYTTLAQLKAEGYTGQANAQGNLLGQAGGILGMFL